MKNTFKSPTHIYIPNAGSRPKLPGGNKGAEHLMNALEEASGNLSLTQMSQRLATSDDRKLITVAETCRLLSLSRSRVYEILGEGSIASISLRKRGMVRGSRRVFLDSVNAFCNALSEQQA